MFHLGGLLQARPGKFSISLIDRSSSNFQIGFGITATCKPTIYIHYLTLRRFVRAIRHVMKEHEDAIIFHALPSGLKHH